MTKSRQRTNAIAYDFGCGQNRRRKDRARDARQPKPEHEREDHENRIERESSSEEHRRRRLALDHVDGDIERSREQSLPGLGDRERAGEQENEKSCGGPEKRDVVENERDRPP
jgi:hypothetical protein